MLRKILLGLLGLVVVLVALGFVLPDKSHVERSAVINAPQEEIYALVSDLPAANQWSPWMAYDPEMKVAIAGAGVGQKQTWESKKMGNSSQEIAALDPPSRVDYALDFGKTMASRPPRWSWSRRRKERASLGRSIPICARASRSGCSLSRPIWASSWTA